MNLTEQIYRIHQMMGINEQDTHFTMWLDKAAKDPNKIKKWVDANKAAFKQFPNFFIIGSWFVPIIGPYISAGLSTYQAKLLWDEGKKAEALIAAVTSPLFLMRGIKILKALGTTGPILQNLELINKIGIPLLISYGQQTFLNWGYQTFGKEFGNFIIALKDEFPKELIKLFKDKEKEKKYITNSLYNATQKVKQSSYPFK